jgi:hypothetical protein
MKSIFITLILLGGGLLPRLSAASEADVEACLEFAKEGENYKVAHKNSHCFKAANEGNHAAQYSVGMGYGFEGDHDLEEKYYRQSAAQGNYAAYMGLGHVLTDKNDEEAIYWYKRYIEAIQKKPDSDKSDKFVAKLITRIYKKNNKSKELEQWLAECEKSVGDCE